MPTLMQVEKFRDLLLRFASSYVLMSMEDLAQAESFMAIRRFEKGEVLCRAGDAFTDLCFVAQGLFKTYFTADDGTTWIRSFSSEGQHLGPYGSILLGRPSSVTVEALEDSVVVSLPFEKMLKLYDLGKKWERFGRLVAEDHYKWWEVREHQLMVLDAMGRYQAAIKMLDPILHRLKQRDIAQFLGVTPEALSRLRKK